MMNDDTLPTADKLVDLWMHQNTLAWSRIKTAIALQAGVIAGWYYSMTDDLPDIAAPLAVFGACLALVLGILVVGDIAARNNIRNVLGARGFPLPFDFGKGRSGRWMAILLTLAFLGCDLTLAWYSIKYPHSMAAQSPDDSDEATSHHVVWNMAGAGCRNATSSRAGTRLRSYRTPRNTSAIATLI